MNPKSFARLVPVLVLLALAGAAPADAQTTARPAGGGRDSTQVTGVVRDERNAVSLPGVTVEVVGENEIAYTDMDGRYTLQLAPGAYELKFGMDGYAERLVRVEVAAQRVVEVNVPLTMSSFTEEVTVTAESITAETSSAEAQLVERKNAPVITDNVGSQEMKKNGDTDAASAMSRVTGLSVVDNQYVFVRGLGERYSNTTLSGSVVPTTEPDKKVVPLDLFPAALIDSIQVAKTYSVDKSAEFAGGLVQIVPLKFSNRLVFDTAFGLDWFENATGKDVFLSPLDGRDFWGFDNGARAIPSSFPDSKIVRSGIYTPDVGFSKEEITAFGRQLENRWLPTTESGGLGPSWSLAFGNSFGKLSLIASARHSYKEEYVEENRKFFFIGEGGQLQPLTDYDISTGTQKAQLGAVANVAYQLNSNHRIGFDNFYTHSGRDEGRFYEGPNLDNNLYFKNSRVQFIEEGLYTAAFSGDHYFPGLANSRVDWRGSWGQASRDEPDLRETLYQRSLTGGTLVLADESQSGFRMFNTLDDETFDLQANWSIFTTLAERPALFKFGPQYVQRTRDFQSRRFRFIPTNLVTLNLSQTPEQLFVSENIGPAFRFNEETRPVDAYDGDQEVFAVYGMGDFVLGARSRLVAGLRVENFDQTVNTFDPFGLFEQTITANISETDLFPSVNYIYQLQPNQNLRFGFSQTTNRPEFRELAAFEFTDIIGNRAVRGNPDLVRALIQNYDVRWELFTGGRNVFAASAFYKNFNDPIERVITGSAQPLSTFQNADGARNLGLEVEVGQQLTDMFFVGANYTFVDSKIELAPEALTVQTSQQRPLAGQSENLFNLTAEVLLGGFQARLLYNFFDDRISDVGAFGAPDVVEEGRGTLDLVLLQRFGPLSLRLAIDNLTDAEYLYTQGGLDQRTYKLGRGVRFGFGYSFF